ncbi:MAG: DUF3800 domain-containing protein [Patescibacteria group bacterium]
MKNIVVFIDESGTLPDPKDKVIVIGAVGTKTPERIEKIIKGIQRKTKLKKKTGELKFYTAGDKTKQLFFERIAKEEIDIFILPIDKMGRKIPDNYENYAILCWFLLEDVFDFYKEVGQIIFDRHFSKLQDINSFNRRLEDLLQRALKIAHVDSKKDKKVNVADMIAGAVLAKETGKEQGFYKLMKNNIVNERRLNWPSAKRRLFR